MGSLIRSEIKKFSRYRKNRILLLVLAIFLISSNVYYRMKEKNYPEYFSDETETSISIAKKRLGEIESELLYYESGEITEEEKDQLLIEKKRQENEYMYETMMLNIIGSKHDKKSSNLKKIILEDEAEEYFLPYTIKRLENIIEADKEDVVSPVTLKVRNITMNEIKRRKTYYDYLSDNNIDVIMNPYVNTGVNSIKGLLENNMIIVIFIILTFLTMDMFLSEIEEDSYKLLYIQPFERKRIFLSKVISMTIIISVIFLLLIGINFIVNSVINGVGDPNYPFAASENIKRISLNNETMNFIIITIRKNIIMSILLILTVLFFNVVLISFLSIYTDSAAKTMGIEIILIMLTLLLREFFSANDIAQSFMPFTYIFTQDILKEKINVNYIIGIILNIGLAGILLWGSCRKFVKKDFLGSKV